MIDWFEAYIDFWVDSYFNLISWVYVANFTLYRFGLTKASVKFLIKLFSSLNGEFVIAYCFMVMMLFGCGSAIFDCYHRWK